MFEGLKGLGSLAGLMKDLPKLKEQMEQAKKRLEQITVEAETGGGAVVAVASGSLQLRKLHIDQALLSGLIDATNPDDQAMAEDLIIGAINTAMDKARQVAEQEMKNAAAEMGLPLPPGGMEGLLS